MAPSKQTYDATGRAPAVTGWVPGVSYNATGQVTTMGAASYGESRQYNILGQMTRLTATAGSAVA